MATEEDLIDSFKTIPSLSAKPSTGSAKPPGAANSSSSPGLLYCQQAAKAICSGYRRDEAHDPEGFAVTLALVMADFDRQVVDYVADPRTGAIIEFPNGLPNVGQIRALCVRTAERMRLLAKPRPIAARPAPPITKPGQITYEQHLERSREHKTPVRPIGAFEPGGYLGPIVK